MKWDVTIRVTRLCVVATTALLSCCGGLSQQQPQTPDKVVRAYARALADGEPAEAYVLMSPAYRARVSFPAWKRQLDANPQEVSEAGRRLSRVRNAADLAALQRRRANKPLQLVKQGERWYIAAEPIEFYDQSTPRAALRSFVAAFAHRRYDVVLRLMPETDKESVTSESLGQSFGHAARSEIARLMAQLRPNLDQPIEVHGNSATMPYAEHRRVQLALEKGRWRIVEPQ